MKHTGCNETIMLPPRFSLCIIFSVGDQIGSCKMATICQITYMYRTCNQQLSGITWPKHSGFPPWVWRWRKNGWIRAICHELHINIKHVMEFADHTRVGIHYKLLFSPSGWTRKETKLRGKFSTVRKEHSGTCTDQWWVKLLMLSSSSPLPLSRLFTDAIMIILIGLGKSLNI